MKTCKAEHLNELNIKFISKVTSKLILLGSDDFGDKFILFYSLTH